MQTQIRREMQKIRKGVNRRGRPTIAHLRSLDQLLSAHPHEASLWAFRGDLIQLCDDESDRYSLSDVLASYRRAIRCDPNFKEGYVEAGYFHLYVRDDPFRALPYFKKALAIRQSRDIQRALHETLKEIRERKKESQPRRLTSCSS